MAERAFTLIGEGNTDRALVPLIRWVLLQHLPDVSINGNWADRRQLPHARQLPERIALCVRAYPCDLLFIHRDADTAGRDVRLREISQAAIAAQKFAAMPEVVVPIIPIRMLEAWLLGDEAALRRAAGNPHGRMPLRIPPVRELEAIADPKTLLRDLIREASGLGAHRRRRVEVDHVRIAELTDSFEPLRVLPAFKAFEEDVRRVIDEQGWPERLG